MDLQNVQNQVDAAKKFVSKTLKDANISLEDKIKFLLNVPPAAREYSSWLLDIPPSISLYDDFGCDRHVTFDVIDAFNDADDFGTDKDMLHQIMLECIKNGVCGFVNDW